MGLKKRTKNRYIKRRLFNIAYCKNKSLSIPCFYCKCLTTRETARLDHVIPICKSGIDKDNTVIACEECDKNRALVTFLHINIGKNDVRTLEMFKRHKHRILHIHRLLNIVFRNSDHPAKLEVNEVLAYYSTHI